ncbi:MAG: MBL fold metallo-hydrolase [candidate division WOR-3 bacterium]|nr:MAG: MBL fold metallo-hydrolase [candidate division WOR-3 bacterium]
MKIKFLGHAAFLIEAGSGVKIITDPYKPGCFDGGIKYRPITEEADIVTISHEHDDHNCTDIQGEPVFVRGAVKKNVKGIEITGMDVFHDESGGSERGTNTIFKMTIDGMIIVHLGDLGHPLSDKDAKQIGTVDILFVPVGGYFTIDAKVAEDTVSKLNPRVVIPMHFKTEKCGFPIAAVDDYVKDKDTKKFESQVEIKKEDLPDKMKIYLLTPIK